MKKRLFRVGTYPERFNALTNQTLPCGDIFQSDGLAAHVQKHHPKETENLSLIPQILADPDYIGHNPKEPDSVELVKVLSANVLVCVKLDAREGYLFVASVYEISSGKLNNRINSGRLKKYEAEKPY